MLLSVVRLYWKTFAITTFAVLAAGVAWLVIPPLQYVSTTQLLVSINGSTTASAYQNDDIVAERISSYIALLTSDAAGQRVVDKLGLPMTPAEFAAKVSATNVPPKTALIDVTVTDTSPSQARLLADTLAQEFVSYTDAIETPTGDDGQKVRTSIVSSASVPRTRIKKRIALGGLVALAAPLLGALAVSIRSMTDPVVRTSSRAAAASGAPVYGAVSAAPATSLDEVEAYRRLRAKLKTSAKAQWAGRVTVLTSAATAVDAIAVASNLGHAIELGGQRSIALNVDAAGDTSVSVPESAVDSADEPTAPPDTAAASADTVSMNAWKEQQVATEAATTVVRRLRGDYDEVILATPPVLTAITASTASEYANLVLLLVTLGTTKRRDVAAASKRLIGVDAPLKGVVLVTNAEIPATEPRTPWTKLLTQRSKALKDSTISTVETPIG
jgi:capsular polysaccharide biosynthesis protein